MAAALEGLRIVDEQEIEADAASADPSQSTPDGDSPTDHAAASG